MNAGNLISDSSAFSKPSLYIWKFSVHVVLKPSLKGFEHNIASMWNEYNWVSWTSFGIVFSLVPEWKLKFSIPMAIAEFSKFAGIMCAALSQHRLLGVEIAQLQVHHFY